MLRVVSNAIFCAVVGPGVLLVACASNPSTGRVCEEDIDCADDEVCGADGRCRLADAGATDGGAEDAGEMGIEAGPPGDDGGVIDSGSQTDAGPASSDAGPPEAGAPDAGSPDAGPPDAGAPDAGPPDAGPPTGCVWIDVPCSTGAPIREFCPSGATVNQLRRCDASLYTPTDSYLDFELCNCGCVMTTCVAWRQVECCY